MLKQPYNHSSGAKLFIQRAHEVTEKWDYPIKRMELFKETHAQDGQFILPAATDAHVSFCYAFVLFYTYILLHTFYLIHKFFIA